MTLNQIRSRALVKLAESLNVNSIINILARNGVTTDSAVKSIMETVGDIAKREGRPATLSDLAGVLSERAQNTLAETPATVGTTVKPPSSGFGKSILNMAKKHKAPVAIGLTGIAAAGGLYNVLEARRKRSFFDKLKGMFS